MFRQKTGQLPVAHNPRTAGMARQQGAPVRRRWSFHCYTVLWFSCLGVTLFLGVLQLLSTQNDHESGSKSKNSEGDVVDCMEMQRQPAFEHPLLRNHTIQMQPSFYPGVTDETEARMINIRRRPTNRRCHQGTVPVRRNIPKADAAVGIRNHGKPYPPRAPQMMRDEAAFRTLHPHEHAVVYVKEGRKYLGAKASFSVWNPKVEGPREFSLAQIWILSKDHTNAIEAGWTVHPTLYGDSKTRFFVFWTSDNYNTRGCYNLQCPGFVQTNSDFPLDFTIEPYSKCGGQQYYITVEIFMDKGTGNWWLFVQGEQVGYWPGELFPELGDGADLVEFGGEVVNAGGVSGRHTGTEMGGGRFPTEGYLNASYVRGIQVVNEDHRYVQPGRMVAAAETPGCYAVRIGGGRARPEWGSHFFYGGPGRSPMCH